MRKQMTKNYDNKIQKQICMIYWITVRFSKCRTYRKLWSGVKLRKYWILSKKFIYVTESRCCNFPKKKEYE